MTAYEKIRSKLKTGDIVLFGGRSSLSIGIRWATRSPWSHVGMVVRVKEIRTILLWESTVLNDIRDIATGKETKGVQLVPLSQRVKSYDGNIAVRLLKLKRSDAMLKSLSTLREELKGRPYDDDMITLLRAAYDGPFGDNGHDLSTLFCSELIAEAYQRMGLLDTTLPSSEYLPWHFSSKSNIKLLKGTLGPEVLIKKVE